MCHFQEGQPHIDIRQVPRRQPTSSDTWASALEGPSAALTFLQATARAGCSSMHPGAVLGA